MPSSSWVSWGKKKPPTSSIAGTHETPQPPSVSVPPYQENEPAFPPATSVARNDYPSTSAPTPPPSAYAPAPSGATGYQTRQTASTGGFSTGPYRTGDAATPASPNTQQGFYRPSQPTSPAQAATTADARNLYSGSGPTYRSPAAGSGYPAPPTYGTSTYGSPAATPPGPSYGAASPPSPSYGATGSGYPQTSATNDYPSTSPRSSYSTTPGAPSAGPQYAAPSPSGSQYTPPPTSYGQTPSGYGQTPSYGQTPTGYGTSPDGQDSSYSPASTGFTASGGFRPGSTNRNGGSLGPGSSNPPASYDGSATRTVSPPSGSGYQIYNR